MFRILIVEDDRALSDGICLALQDKEHRLVQAEDLDDNRYYSVRTE